MNLISHCWGVVITFLQHGIMCRGHITRGRIHHTEIQFIGTGYQNAYEAERQVSLFHLKPTPMTAFDPKRTFAPDVNNSRLCSASIFSVERLKSRFPENLARESGA